MPVVLIVIGLSGLTRFLGDVPTVNAVGLFASGALVGVSFMRLLYTRRR